MRRVHLIREFAPDAYEFALSSWSWIGTGDKTPRFASCFGDMFLESLDGWWFLDTVEGTLERRWSTMDDMFAELEGEEGRAEYLLEETLNAALGQGLRLDDDEVFAFLPPPAVTGTMSVDSLAPLRFAIAANLAGRIHGELNGVQPDAGASALFAAQQAAAQQAAAQQAAAQSYAAQGYAAQNTAAQGAAPAFDAPNPQTDRWEPSAQQVSTGAYETRYAAGSELDYGSGQQAYGPGGHPAAPSAGYTAPAPSGTHTAGPSGYTAYDYVDNSHTADSGQFSQYIADQYNTGQVAAVEPAASVPAQPGPYRDGRWSYA